MKESDNIKYNVKKENVEQESKKSEEKTKFARKMIEFMMVEKCLPLPPRDARSPSRKMIKMIKSMMMAKCLPSYAAKVKCLPGIFLPTTNT